MAKTLTLTGSKLKPADVVMLAQNPARSVALAPAALARVRTARSFVEREARRRIAYGINTGFGPMATKIIDTGHLLALQENLVRSHACGAGEPVPERVALGAMIARLNALLRGESGVSVELVKRIAFYINHRIVPVIPEHGGVGASGDLIQLAHVALALMGEGDVLWRGERRSAAAVLKRLRMAPYRLKEKEGLALINGTSYMTAAACFLVEDARRTLALSVRSAALALETAHAFSDALSPALSRARPHVGQERIARALRALTDGSRLLRSRRTFERSREVSAGELAYAAQDVYSLRAVPQILGPALETLHETERVVSTELNATTDNPIVDVAGRAFVHGGNFHGEYVAAAADNLKRALIKLAMLSERRLNYMLNAPLNGHFPPFLNLGTPGLTLALQGLQFTATSTTARAQTLGYPHSLHSISSNGDNQDVVSMGADAVYFAQEAERHARLVVALELTVLSQALACGNDGRALSPAGKRLLALVRGAVPPVIKDRPLANELSRLMARLDESDLDIVF